MDGRKCTHASSFTTSSSGSSSSVKWEMKSPSEQTSAGWWCWKKRKYQGFTGGIKVLRPRPTSGLHPILTSFFQLISVYFWNKWPYPTQKFYKLSFFFFFISKNMAQSYLHDYQVLICIEKAFTKFQWIFLLLFKFRIIIIQHKSINLLFQQKKRELYFPPLLKRARKSD